MSSLDGNGPCDDCGTEENIIWTTNHTLWNRVCRPPGYERDGILCITCFVKKAVAVGLDPLRWELVPIWGTEELRT